ncbi:MAG: GNAT family N-acetyltransferase [Pseudomonadota bacterium]
MSIDLEDAETKGRYVAHIEGSSETGELTFSKTGSTLIIVDHTEVPDSLRGKGVGLALAKRAVEDARKNKVKIVPLCPFFKATAQRHPDWSDVVQ